MIKLSGLRCRILSIHIIAYDFQDYQDEATASVDANGNANKYPKASRLGILAVYAGIFENFRNVNLGAHNLILITILITLVGIHGGF